MLAPFFSSDYTQIFHLSTLSRLCSAGHHLKVLFLSLPRSFLTSTDKENMFTLDHFPVWYRRAAENPAGQFLYYMPRQETRGRVYTSLEYHYLASYSSLFLPTLCTFMSLFLLQFWEFWREKKKPYLCQSEFIFGEFCCPAQQLQSNKFNSHPFVHHINTNT